MGMQNTDKGRQGRKKFPKTLQNYLENATKKITHNCRRAGSRQHKITVTTIDISNK
jgi:hypothetical protein